LRISSEVRSIERASAFHRHQFLDDSHGNSLNNRFLPFGTRYRGLFAMKLFNKSSAKHFQQCIDRLLPSTRILDLPNRMQDGGVMSPVVEFPNLWCAPASNVLRQVHRDLPAEPIFLPVAPNSTRTEMQGHHLLNPPLAALFVLDIISTAIDRSDSIPGSNEYRCVCHW
jgi:hypothetical protein